MANRRSPAQSIRCFVAMAFDHTDTDAVFRRMRSTLKEIGVYLVRVDAIEHNEDIDERIISEIKKADFVLADLTYARPSVYFEAGYAQRSVPVIYTARRDHFRPRVDDPNGNLRVHFDLQMKNIIAWSSPEDVQFPKRLKARVSKVIAPLVATKKSDTEAKRRALEFEGMASQDKLELLRKVARKHLRRLGYRVTELDYLEDKRPAFLNLYVTKYFWRAILAMRRDGDTLRVVLLHPVASVTKELCQIYHYQAVGDKLYTGAVFGQPPWIPGHVKEDLVICSLSGSSAIPKLAKEIPYLARGVYPRSLVCKRQLRDRSLDADGRQVERDVTVHVVESTPNLANLNRELCDRVPI